jgi:hypothetical protein
MGPRQTSWISFLIAASLLLVTLVLYRPVSGQDFVRFDDSRYVIENRAIHRGLDAEAVRWAFTTDRMGTWHPLTWLSHAADWDLYGADPSGHHLTNLVLHAINVLLLFALLRWMTGSLWASAFVAFVFAVHPLNVSSVAWVASRKGLLSTAFWLLTIGAYAGYCKKGGALRYIAMLAAFALGLLSKPVLVTLPLVLLLLDLWPLHRWSPDGTTAEREARLIEKLPLFAMAAALSVVTFWVRQTGEPVAWTERLSQVPRAYLVYLRRIFWPSDLATPYPALEPVTVLQTAGALIALLALSFWAIRGRRQRPYLLVGWLWFLITLAPVIGFVQVGGHPMADRWMYVPMIGILIMLAWGLPSFLPSGRPLRIAVGTAGLVVLVALSAVTHKQIGYWQNSETLFRRAIAVTERNRVAHYNLAWFLAKEGRAEEAVLHYRRAIEIDPTHFASQHNLGLLLIEEGRKDEALEPLCAALRLADSDEEALRKRLAEHLEGASCP